MKILDIGTGPGTIPLNLKKLYPDIHFIGVDISLGMIHAAKEHATKNELALPLCMGDGESLPFGTGKMDGVISFFAMHHMDHPERLLLEVDRVLKPDGWLLLIDFHRDMSRWLFRFMNGMWQSIFMFSDAKKGFVNSVRSAWRKDEMHDILKKHDLERFKVHTNRLELWVTTK
jgi:ubiquinone/menaquinone biosynthesis C-methylase UbiE